MPSHSRRSSLALLAALVTAVLVAGAWQTASAQLLPIGPRETTTTTEPDNPPPPQEQESTTTTAPPIFAPPAQPKPQPSGSSTTTTTAPPAPSTPLPPAPEHEGDGQAPPPDSGGFPPHLQALMDSVERTPASSTKSLLAALAPLEQFGLDETERAVVGFGRFPVSGLANYSHDWWFPRYGPGWRLHQGTDIFGKYGAPVRAPVDGRVRIKNGGLGGLNVTVFQPDGTYWYLAHLSGVPSGLADGATVKTGDVIGYVGTSGNAVGTPPHVHLQIHPQGGSPIDPKSVLDAFIADATALAPKVIEAYAQAAAAGGEVAATPTVLPLPEPDLSLALPHRSTELWATSVSPMSGTLHFAEHEVRRAADRVDWAARGTVTARAAAARLEASFAVQRWLAPLVPTQLAWVLQAA